MKRSAISSTLTILISGLLAGLTACGSYNNGPALPPVAQVKISNTSLSLNAGDVVTISATALDTGGNLAPVDISFSSSNTSILTVSPPKPGQPNSADVCAGTWDSNFIVCKGTNSSGQPVSGQATIVATANGISSAGMQVSIHPPITSVVVDPVTGCTSATATKQFTAHVFSNGVDVTNQVGAVNWNVVNSQVASVDVNGLVTAQTPGITGVFASLGTVSSAATPFKTCMPVSLRLHVPNSQVTSVTLASGQNPPQTQTVEVDMTDENGVATQSPAIPFFTTNVLSTPPSLTLGANTPGGAGIVAACAPPGCGIGINQPVYSNLFTVNSTGASPSTTVYVTSTSPPPPGSFTVMFPVDTSNNTVGTAINLPGPPNSLVFAANGQFAYLGTTAGLALLQPSGNTVTVVSSTTLGKVLAVSQDGSEAIVSNAATDPTTGQPFEPNPANQRIFLFDHSTGLVQPFAASGAVAAAFDVDNFKIYVTARNGNVYVLSSSLAFQTLAPGGAGTSVTNLASGSFTFVANSTGLLAFATCNNAQQANAPTNGTPQLVSRVPNADKIVAVDSTGVNDISVTTGAPASGFCPPTATFSNAFTDFGAGAFTAHQLLVDTLGTRAVVLPAAINKILVAPLNGGAPSQIALPAGGTEAVSGALTLDGTLLWAGVAGTNTLEQFNLTNNTNPVHVNLPNLKKADGSLATPDLVAIQPK